MLPNPRNRLISGAILAGTTLALLLMTACGQGDNQQPKTKAARAAPVEVAAITQGPITLWRTFNGTLAARAEFTAAPKIGGRVELLAVNLADPVTRGQMVAALDNGEYVQAVTQAEADLAVANANLVETTSALEIAKRDFARVQTLNRRGVASESQFDATMANLAAKEASLEVTRAHLARAEALLETARIKLGYTRVTADWHGGASQRVVAERYVDEGHTVAANTPLLRIVELDPLTGIIFVTEKDYARLQVGQTAQLTTDAYPGETFAGRLDRISPVFQKETRQARVELAIANPGFRLKPGMFVRATVQLAHVADATIVPEAALTSRDNQTGLFVVNAKQQTVTWQPVQIGIREGNQVQVMGTNPGGLVVAMGQQLLDDGSLITISSAAKPRDPAAP